MASQSNFSSKIDIFTINSPQLILVSNYFFAESFFLDIPYSAGKGIKV
tara:strand:- start:487 stop:630 length:144 start_codon:yes stop_codon:yes gene_type:complete